MIPGSLAPLVSQFSGYFNGITLETLGLAAIIVFMGWVLNKFSNLLIGRGVRRRGGDKHAAKSAKKVSAYVIYPLTFVALLGVFGVPLSGLGAAVGLIGLGISFALKDVIANFISGVAILVSRPFKIGDQIEVGDEEGTVKDIRVRATDVRTYDGRKVIVPNSKLYNEVVVNNTAYDERRIEVVVGVSYDDDVQEAKDIAEEVLKEADAIENEPEPQVLVSELGGSSVDLKLRGWTKPSKASMVSAASEVTRMIKERYDKEGIDIPYPIRTVNLNEE